MCGNYVSVKDHHAAGAAPPPQRRSLAPPAVPGPINARAGYSSFHSGRRFSRKAEMPSTASWVSMFLVMTSEAYR